LSGDPSGDAPAPSRCAPSSSSSNECRKKDRMIQQVEHGSAEPNPAATDGAGVDPPVAPGVPILGAARAMLNDATGFVLRTTAELGPLFRIPLGPRSLTLIAHPDDLRLVLQEQNKDFPRGRVVDPIRPMLGNGLPMTDADVWRRKR